MGYHGKPFLWDEERRALVRAELDAYYARLYGLNRKQLRYILDPADLTPRELEDILDPWEEVADPLAPQGYAQRSAASDFPGETFRVLKDKENRQYGEYRTRRLVLEAWERLKDQEIGSPEGDQGAKPDRRETISVPSRPDANRQLSVPDQPQRDSGGSEKRSKPEKRVAQQAEQAVDEKQDPSASQGAPVEQPTLTDFGLYKCELCGKIVMGFEKAKHEQEVHRAQAVSWKQMR